MVEVFISKGKESFMINAQFPVYTANILQIINKSLIDDVH